MTNIKELSKVITETINKNAFSGVIEIFEKGKMLYSGAAGYADRSNKIKNSLNTRFAIASGTKLFTALAIGKLIEEGKLNFSTKLSDCLKFDFPTYSPLITIDHLLNHTSGIPDYYDEEKIEDFDNFHLSTPWFKLQNLEDYLPVLPVEEMKFSPGERFSYSNSGFILLGLVVEALSGQKFRDFVTERILGPCGMEDSGFFSLDRLPEQTALGYIDSEDGSWRTNVYNLPVIGGSDGGLFTTVQDIHTLWTHFLGGKIISPELVEAYIKPRVKAETEGENIYYGRGIYIYQEPGNTPVEFIQGCDAGVSFNSTFNRTRELLITQISNTTEGVWKIMENINAFLYG